MENNTSVEVINSPQDTALYLITKAEVDQQIATAKAFPRDLKTFMSDALSIATLTEEIADSCNYALPRGGKVIEGPSVRLAEIIVSAYGNVRAAARVISNDGREITAQGICHDLEKNVCMTFEVKRSIMQNEWAVNPTTGRREKTGNMLPMNEDMQIVVGNAACAIAFRNVVYKVIPAAIINPIYEQCKLVAKGTAETLVKRREKAVEWFGTQGVKPDQICRVLSVKNIEAIDLDKLQVLSGIRSAIKNGESTVKEIFEEVKAEPVVDVEKLDKEKIKKQVGND